MGKLVPQGNWERSGVGEIKECEICEKRFSAYRHKQKYCSKSCQKIAMKGKNYGLVDLTCQQCGCSYQKPGTYLRRNEKEGRSQVCSGRCLALLRGTKVERPCDHCGKLVFRNKKEVDKYQFIFCSKGCETESYLHRKTGEAHYRFKDGATSLPYGLGWTLARQRARKRDNYTCQDCGVTEKELGRKLDVHHLIPFRDLSDPVEAHKLTNLISFCSSCHHRIEAEQIKEPEILTRLREMVG